MKSLYVLLLLILAAIPGYSQKKNCTAVNKEFLPGESITYEIFYNWGFIWVSSGEATFKVEREKFAGSPCWKFSGTGKTYPKYDWFYKVRDTYAAWVDSTSLLPYRYLRDSKEGSHNLYNDNYFNYNRSAVTSYTKENDSPIRTDTIPIRNCAYDVTTMIYYARTLDFSKCKIGDKVPIYLYLDSKFYNQDITYLGKDVLETDLGKFNCVKFSPRLIEGTIFKEGDDMIVWVTDDANRIPLKVETPIVVGSIQAILKSYSGLRNPITSKIEK
jgi:hypothetical protein